MVTQECRHIPVAWKLSEACVHKTVDWCTCFPEGLVYRLAVEDGDRNPGEGPTEDRSPEDCLDGPEGTPADLRAIRFLRTGIDEGEVDRLQCTRVATA